MRVLLGHCAMVLCLCTLLLLPTPAAQAEGQPDWVTDKLFKSVVPGAIYAGQTSNDPPVATIYGAGEIAGYAFEVSAIVETVGFSGAPFKVLVGLNVDGQITGVTIVQHAEPILDYGDNGGRLDLFVDQYEARDYAGRIRLSTGSEAGEINGISGATVSARAFHHAIIQSARTVARSLGLIDGAWDTATVNMVNFEPLGWADLIAAGAVQGYDLQISALDEGGVDKVAAQNELYLALLTPASIGRNLVSRGLHKRFVSPQSADDLVFLLMSRSIHSVVGKKVFETGTFDRIRVRQDGRDFTLTRQGALYRYVPFLVAEGAPTFSEMGIFRVPAESGIEVLKPWQLVVDLRSMDAAVDDRARRALTYELPARFVLPPSNSITAKPEISPVGAAWQAQSSNIIILATALSVLTAMLILMQTLTRRVWLYRTARTGFLLFTLIWLGWIVGAQLSVINPIAWAQAFGTGNGLELFLLDPLLAILTLFVVASFVIWGRGVFCGWLCPFGALQELLSLIARSLKLPQVTLSYRTHRSLWPIKHIVLAAVVLSAFHGPVTLGAAAEIEPFKTAISLKFDRALPYVVYAVGLLVIGLFIERAFCRFLCPLGALMAIGGKLRLGNALKRRDECGSPCQLCARRCPIQAIAPTGRINMDECFYCLDCQVIYQDAHACPPLITKRKRAVRPRVVKA